MPGNVAPVPIDRKEAGVINVLLAGKHGENFDSMIIANINTNKGVVGLISIPRDIFFNGRKINSAGYYYGIEELKRQLGIVAGLHIDHYMIIDMYAFIEVIDLMGGIDIYMYEPLVDPTYKTFDNGEWGTLDYQRGEYHLSGVQALRLARSRATSSDFARAERQQDIIVSIKNKANSLGAGDAGRIAYMISAILKRTQTDMSYKTMMSYALRFKNYSAQTKGSLSTFNVLKSETQIAELKEDEEEEKCYKKLPNANRVIEIKCAPRFEGQYILVPREDWNTVRWYVRKILN